MEVVGRAPLEADEINTGILKTCSARGLQHNTNNRTDVGGRSWPRGEEVEFPARGVRRLAAGKFFTANFYRGNSPVNSGKFGVP